MLYLDENKLTLSEIRQYNGDDFFIKDLKKLLANIESNPTPGGIMKFQYHKSLIFKSKGQTKGGVKITIKERKRGIKLPLSYIVQTGDGTQNFTWCESAQKTVNGFIFKPKKKDFDGNWSLHCKRDAEFILFVMTALPEYKHEHIVLNDPIKKDNETAETRRRMSSLDYYLYNKLSPLVKDSDRLLDIALAWGISVEGATINGITNQLYDSVINAEKSKNTELNIDAFLKAVDEELPFMDELVLVQKAIDGGIISYSDGANQWNLIVGDKPKRLCVVPITAKDTKNNVLAKYFGSHVEVVEIIKASLGVKDAPAPKPKAQDTGEEDGGSDDKTDDGDGKSVLELYNKDTDFTKLSWQELRKIGFALKTKTMKKDPIIEDVTKYYGQ